MDLGRREHNYGDLRQAVMQVMLEAADRGLDDFETLLKKVALELDKQDGFRLARHKLPPEPGAQLHPNDSEQVLEIVWDLVRQGILNFGLTASPPEWRSLRLTRFGESALRHAACPFHNNTGFMKAVRSKAAEVSPQAVVYLREAASAFYTDCLLSACVVLSMAAESEFLSLLNVAKNSKAYSRYFSSIDDWLNIDAKILQFKSAIEPILGLLPDSATDEFDHNLTTIQSVIRTVRNAAGEPSGASPPSRDQVYLYLQFFISFAEQAMRLRQALNEPAYPRLVRAH